MSAFRLMFLSGFLLLGSVTSAGSTGVLTIEVEPINPPNTIPHAGGHLSFIVEVDNDAEVSLDFDVWTSFSLSGSGEDIPGQAPAHLILPAGWTATEEFLQVISGGLPEGVYIYSVHAGLFPSEIWASASFEFEKLAGAVGWYAQSPGNEHDLTGVFFVDVNTGWAVSSYREILYTNDGGDIWVEQDDGQYYPHQYNDLHFVDSQTGWVVGHGWSLGGTILHTSDGGTTWVEQDHDTDNELVAVHFVDAFHGWAVGGYVDIFGSSHRKVIEHTSDGGSTWDQQYWDSYSYPLQAVCFVDENHGWAVGGPGDILHTFNGGNSWVAQDAGTVSYLQDVDFLDADMGWCVGDTGTVLQTLDGGQNWFPVSVGVNAEFFAVDFVDEFKGWIAGVNWNTSLPVIQHTSDGGVSWESQETGTGEGFALIRDLCFVDANHGWAAGTLWPDLPVMLHTENGGGGLTTGVWDAGGPELAAENSLVSDPFPNPFNPQTSIRYAITDPKGETVMIRVFDVEGRLVRILVNEIRSMGEHRVIWDGRSDDGRSLPSGLYLYRAAVGGFSSAGKLTLLK